MSDVASALSPTTAAKAVVLDYYRDLDAAPVEQLAEVIARHTTPNYEWRGVHPFYEQHGAAAVAHTFWIPLRNCFAPLQRRPDIFLAGINTVSPDEGPVDGGSVDGAVWVCQMGHLLGLFDNDWLGIAPNHRMCFLRYAEFHRVEDTDPTQGSGRIAETALFIDVISVMNQAGQNPLPPWTGASQLHPGPRTHDGLMLDDAAPAEGDKTMALVDRMIDDLDQANRIANETGDDRVPPEAMATTWHHDMIWYGPGGIGASYTIARYQHQHQYPFRFNLTDKVFNGHVARFAEGDYACFFGWSNLTNTPSGGFLGLPESGPADMRVVDVYRRDGDKLAENWVFIDVLHWLSMQGLDVLARQRQLRGQEEF